VANIKWALAFSGNQPLYFANKFSLSSKIVPVDSGVLKIRTIKYIGFVLAHLVGLHYYEKAFLKYTKNTPIN